MIQKMTSLQSSIKPGLHLQHKHKHKEHIHTLQFIACKWVLFFHMVVKCDVQLVYASFTFAYVASVNQAQK